MPKKNRLNSKVALFIVLLCRSLKSLIKSFSQFSHTWEKYFFTQSKCLERESIKSYLQLLVHHYAKLRGVECREPRCELSAVEFRAAVPRRSATSELSLIESIASHCRLPSAHATSASGMALGSARALLGTP